MHEAEMAYLVKIFYKKFEVLQPLIKKLSKVASPGRTFIFRKRSPCWDAKKSSFPNMRMYNGNSDLDNHMAHY